MRSGNRPTTKKGQPGLVSAALFGLCPRCAAPGLFETPGRIAVKCSACGLPFADLERGGRAAGLVTIIVAGMLIAAAMGVDSLLQPPFWLQALIWAPLTVGAVLGALRLFKAYMLMVQYEGCADHESDDT